MLTKKKIYYFAPVEYFEKSTDFRVNCPVCNKDHYFVFCPKCESGYLFEDKDKQFKFNKLSWHCDICKKDNPIKPSANQITALKKESMPPEVLEYYANKYNSEVNYIQAIVIVGLMLVFRAYLDQIMFTLLAVWRELGAFLNLSYWQLYGVLWIFQIAFYVILRINRGNSAVTNFSNFTLKAKILVFITSFLLFLNFLIVLAGFSAAIFKN